MGYSAHDAYLESRVLSADPVELVRLLYQAATAAVRDARRYLAEGDIAARSRAISKAFDVLMELTVSLDHTRGGEISLRLAQLYDYMQRRLTEANLTQADAPLAEVAGLLATLEEAWSGIEAQPAPAADAHRWSGPFEQEPAGEAASSGWSF